MGDWYEEMAAELERMEAWENAPEPEPITDEELEDWYERDSRQAGFSTDEE